MDPHINFFVNFNGEPDFLNTMFLTYVIILPSSPSSGLSFFCSPFGSLGMASGGIEPDAAKIDEESPQHQRAFGASRAPPPLLP